MKKVFRILAISVSGVLILKSCSTKNFNSAKLKTKNDTVSYYLGLSYGGGIKQAEIDSIFNYDAFMKGMTEAVKADTMPVSDFEMKSYLNSFFAELQEQQLQKQFKDYIAENKDFLDKNSKKDSVVSLTSGLQYSILKAGNGNKPTMNDKVKVHYTGKLIDGTIFDSSYQRNVPAEFVVGQVIPGWVEALQLMPVGSKWRLFIPENLAYGAQPPRGSSIKPYSTLVFDVEILEILPNTQQ